MLAAMSARHFDDLYFEHAVLRDGTEVMLRLVQPHDKQLLRHSFERLSESSRYSRFFAHKRTLTDAELRYLCELDHETHLAIGAQQFEANGVPIGMGIARYILLRDRPQTAEAAIAVADEAQGKGLGKLLFLRLCAAARERSIAKFRCEVLATNRSMRHLLEAIAPSSSSTEENGVVSIELVVPDVSPTASISAPAPDDGMYKLLRTAAERTLDWTEALKRLWGLSL